MSVFIFVSFCIELQQSYTILRFFVQINVTMFSGIVSDKGALMHPDKVRRETTQKLTDLPNIGPSMARSLHMIGISKPEQLVGRDPVELYGQLCENTGSRQDPCVLDVLMSVTDFMNGGEPKQWWAYTSERKKMTQIP